jgi:UDP-N-acetylmuramoyl-L-alanyl-D-glutamate--2,6-diaminopimelate ligase
MTTADRQDVLGAPPRPVRLGALVREIPGATIPSEAESVLVTGVHHDSRAVQPGDVFVARAGLHTHGGRFVADAIARGAVAVIVERGSEVPTAGAARVEVDDVPRALALAAAAAYGHPTFALDVVGITGTNGKTTTAHLVQSCIDAAGGRAGIVGTLGYRFGTLDLAPTHTSPEADELARIAAGMLARGATHLVMEVSSIALAAARADAVRFRVAAFTNLTQDHLDYHGTMEAYAAAKARLFTDLAPGAAAINVDDGFGRALAERLARESAPAAEQGHLARFSARVGAEGVEVAPIALEQVEAGTTLAARTPNGVVEIRTPLLGAHNVSNLLCAVSIGWLLGLDLDRVGAALSGRVVVPGRLERCDEPALDDVVVLVDYAHTPDALVRVLDSVRPLARGKVVCVFGCGGDRDPGKRPLMGEAVGRAADVAIVTNDNPRSEDPRAIADAILPGLRGGCAAVEVELDRAKAIELAIAGASAGDVVLVAGKGHEPYQIIGGVTTAFDDREEARAALARRRARRVERS